METIHAEYLEEKIKKIPVLASATLYWNEHGKWLSLKDKINEADGTLSKSFNALSSERPFAKIKSPSRAIFQLSDPNIAVVLPIGAKTHNDTLAHHHHRLDECLTAATSSFHAHYDELTTVLNRHGLRHAITNEISETNPIDSRLQSSEVQLVAKRDILLFSFDIDRFKSVNDTLGHSAGDIVLSAFARRLDDVARELHKEFAGKFIFGRPGGEEFELIAVGSFSVIEREQLGAKFLDEIRRPLITSLSKIKEQTLGPLSKAVKDRLSQSSGITASIGVSWRQLTQGKIATDDLHSSLRKEADAGLYRAKADGRDCLRAYSDIRLKHGRVMEYFEDSALVQIDIGEKVGVRTGDTFSVFYPPFTGGEKIKESEKGNKVLGKFPPVECARIRVISVETEASICDVLDAIGTGNVTPGALLRYIHIGSQHISATRKGMTPNLVSSVSDIFSYVQLLRERQCLGAICLFVPPIGLTDEKMSLIFKEINLAVSMLFPSESQLFFSLGSNIYIVIPDFHLHEEKDFDSQIRTAFDALRNIVKGCSLNVCVFSDIPEGFSQETRDMLFYCNSLLQHQFKEDTNGLLFFDEFTPLHTLHGWKNTGDIENLIVDYIQYRKVGANSADLHNHFGLAVVENEVREYFDLAIAAFRIAIENHPEQEMYSANLGVILTRQEKYEEAYQLFCRAREKLPESSVAYSLCFAKAAVELLKAGGDVDREELRELLKTGAFGVNPFHDQRYFSSLQDEIRNIYLNFSEIK